MIGSIGKSAASNQMSIDPFITNFFQGILFLFKNIALKKGKNDFKELICPFLFDASHQKAS